MSLLDANLPAVRTEVPSQFHVLTVVAVVLLALSAAWGLVDPRLVDGAPVWMKPLKFALSFAVLFGTLALVEARLSPAVRDGWPLRITGWVMAAAFLSEMAYMMYQGARAEPSHFNMSTPFHEFMYTVVMAAGAVSLVVAVGVIGWIARRDRGADLGPALREGVWLGFGLSFVLTLVVAGYMSGGTGHFVGLHREGAPTLPLMGWSGVTGDLRPAHFAALHAMQVLPLLGLWLDRRGTVGAVRTVRLAAAGYAAVTLAVFVQALMGLPLIPLA
ncbi:hypothetical protein [Roseicyclus persicicus]|uniref:Uncharacterized protein n=1 Tax=Roseicyclus persicicus TaxID=2650661 RepID=A0A7X6GZQ3_9RHOB|nr:hypothetical protein [Roseibacterium persicicum]NKX44216.1 hypothetical protein [Roseibacterium persicicum]